jgi:hypothetical protein
MTQAKTDIPANGGAAPAGEGHGLRALLIVRDGKGFKDRVVMLPRSLADDLLQKLAQARYCWDADRAGVSAPHALDVKNLLFEDEDCLARNLLSSSVNGSDRSNRWGDAPSRLHDNDSRASQLQIAKSI